MLYTKENNYGEYTQVKIFKRAEKYNVLQVKYMVILP